MYDMYGEADIWIKSLKASVNVVMWVKMQWDFKTHKWLRWPRPCSGSKLG